MKPKYIIIILAVVTVITVFYSCKDNPVTPDIKPGRRDYTWTVDTLFIPFTYLERIWGSSPNDVWAIGQGGDKDKIIYHYDGNKWSNDGKSRPAEPFALWGFGPDDVWIGGYGPLFHYDGTDWQKDFEYINPDLTRYGIQDIWGDSPDNVWAVGFADSSNVRKGIIFHYNGIKWNRINIGFTRTTMMQIRRGRKTSNNYFIWGLRESNIKDDTTKLLEFDGEKLKEIFSGIDISTNSNFVQEIDNEIIFTKGFDLVKYLGNYRFSNIVHIENPEFGVQIFGRTIKDIFLRMEDGIAHFNGNDVRYLLKFEGDDNIREGMIFENEVFFLANNFSKSLSLIYHGKQK